MEGSECDAFNQRIDNAIEKIMRSEDESETTEGSNARGVDAKWIWRTKQMTIDRAIEILNPEHRECYDGIDEVTKPAEWAWRRWSGQGGFRAVRGCRSCRIHGGSEP